MGEYNIGMLAPIPTILVPKEGTQIELLIVLYMYVCINKILFF